MPALNSDACAHLFAIYPVVKLIAQSRSFVYQSFPDIIISFIVGEVVKRVVDKGDSGDGVDDFHF